MQELVTQNVTYSKDVISVDVVWSARLCVAEHEILKFARLWQTLLLYHQLSFLFVYHTVL